MNTGEVGDARLPDPRMIPPARTQSWFDSAAEEEPESAPAAGAEVFVRPFIVTGGRTQPWHDGLRIETLVQSAPAAPAAPLHFELRQIVELCQQPTSLAEIAALLGVPLGVARVLVADLYKGRFVQLRQPAEVGVRVLERIRDLVRAL